MKLEDKFKSINKVKTFSTGNVLKVLYLQRVTKFRRVFSFIGICTIINNKTKGFILQNFYGPDFIKFHFLSFSPNIIYINLLKSYNFKFNKKKLYNIKRMHLKNKTDKIYFLPKPKELYLPEKFLYETGYIESKEKKRLRNKFRV